jgi:hypothetical protein
LCCPPLNAPIFSSNWVMPSLVRTVLASASDAHPLLLVHHGRCLRKRRLQTGVGRVPVQPFTGRLIIAQHAHQRRVAVENGLQHRQIRVQVRVLRQKLNPHVAPNGNLPGVHAFDAGDQAQQRRFAAAVRDQSGQSGRHR